MAFRDPEELEAIFGDLEPRIRRRIREAFGRSVEELREQFSLNEIADMIENQGIGAITAVVTAEGVRQAMQPVGAEFQDGIIAAGRERAEQISGEVEGPRGVIQFAFDPGAQETADRLREGRLRLIREISDDQERVARAAVADSLERGENPRVAARVMRDSIGLTERQHRAVQNYRRMLEEGESGALDRELRDRRFDPSVRRAVSGERALSQDQIDRMTDRYRQRMVRHRAEVIARTESLRALSEGREAARQQMIDDGVLDPSQVRRFWINAGDSRVRENHTIIPITNSEGVGANEPFSAPLGPLRFPRDPRGLAAQTVQCRCAVSERIDDFQETA